MCTFNINVVFKRNRNSEKFELKTNIVERTQSYAARFKTREGEDIMSLASRTKVAKLWFFLGNTYHHNTDL